MIILIQIHQFNVKNSWIFSIFGTFQEKNVIDTKNSVFLELFKRKTLLILKIYSFFSISDTFQVKNTEIKTVKNLWIFSVFSTFQVKNVKTTKNL